MKNSIVTKLEKDINDLENKIKYRKLNNVKNYVAKSLIKTGIGLDYALPFIMSGIIAVNLLPFEDNKPFYVDKISEKAKVETINTSSGYSVRNISYDYDYNDEILEHTTGWTINDLGLYERIVTSYRLNDTIDLSNTEEIFAMTKEEIDNALVITNINVINKSFLDIEDLIYSEEAIILIDNFTSEDEYILRDETIGENILYSLYYLLIVMGLANILKFVKKKTIKDKIKYKLNICDGNLRIIKKEELDKLKNILELKKNNFDLITGKMDYEKEEIKVLRKSK